MNETVGTIHIMYMCVNLVKICWGCTSAHTGNIVKLLSAEDWEIVLIWLTKLNWQFYVFFYFKF